MLGVVGGMALAAVVVFIVVPLARWHKRKRGGSVRTTRTTGNESNGSRRSWWGFSASCRSSFRQSRHHHHHKEKTGGPYDGLMQPLLPELAEVSAFTWSDLHQTKDSGAESVDELDVADASSLPTNHATLSHWSTANSETNSAPSDHPYSVLGGHSGSANHPKRRRSTVTQLPPSAKRSLSPPGIPPHTSSSPLGLGPYNLLHVQVSPSGSTISPTPTVSLPTAGPGAPTAAFANTLTDKTLSSPSVDMQPVSEDHHVNSKLGSASRPASLQLPSPPASPPQHNYTQLPHLSQSRSGSASRSRSNSQQVADWRFTNAQRSRPPLSSTLSTPATLPFRPPAPRASTSTSGWIHPGSQHAGLPAATLPLTSAFQSPLSRPGSQTSILQRNPSTLTNTPPSIPETSVYDGRSRSRPPSIMSERPTRVPQGARPKPVDTLRQESISTSRSARRASMPVSPSPPSSYNLPPAVEERPGYSRSNSSLQTPQIESTTHAREGRSVTSSYPDQHRHPSQSDTMDRGPEQSHPSDQPSLNSRDHAYQSPSLHEFGNSRRNSVSSVVVPGASSSRSRQPAFVRREDSQALKPIPAATLLHSPPHSPPRGSHSRSGSINYVRSRAGSTASFNPPSSRDRREGGERDRSGRNANPQAVLPVVERLPPMEFGSFESSSGHGSGDK